MQVVCQLVEIEIGFLRQPKKYVSLQRLSREIKMTAAEVKHR